MSNEPLASSRLNRIKLSPRAVSFGIVFLVFLGTILLRHAGWLQFLEFQCYDLFIRHQAKAETSDPIVLVEMTEQDIHNLDLDYPIYDNKLAELLRLLEAGHPAVIGVDLWRDISVPKNGQFAKELNEVFQSQTNIIAIFTRGGLAQPISPPPALKDFPDRLGFNDNFPPDVGVDRTIPKVRRTELYDKSRQYSFPFRLASLYLEGKGIEPEPDPKDPNALRLGKACLRQLQPNDGAYVRADTGSFEILLDFKCPDQFARFTVSDALSGKIPNSVLRDKIVLIGMNTPSVSDERVTPVRRDHHGLEVQANAVHQLLRMVLQGDQTLHFWNDGVEDLWILAWCVAGGMIGFEVRSPWRFALILFASLLALAAIAWLSFDARWWIPLVSPAVGYVPAAALVTSYVSFHEKKQRGQLMQLFSKHVSPDIAQAVWERRDEFFAGERPRSQKLTATVLFTDLEGFSSTSEKLEPAILMDWLNEYMETMATTIMAHQGVIDKYIGDAIMAVFGVPLARSKPEEIQEDARNAVRCALHMREKMTELNVLWKKRGLPSCGMRIGIHTGPLVAGSLGSADRQNYTVIGDSVNTASRLESYDKNWEDADSPRSPCRILISEATFSLVQDIVQTRRVGTILLKNKKEPVTVYSVTAVSRL